MSRGRSVSPDSVEEALRISAQLDVRFHDLKGDAVVTSKDGAFRELFRILEASGLEYALIGGVAVQLWRREPRTTLDIDVAVKSYESVPRAALEAASLLDLWRMSDRALRELQQGSAMMRAPLTNLRRNVAVAIGNAGGDEARRALDVPAAGDRPSAADPMVREHVAWARAHAATAGDDAGEPGSEPGR